MRCEKKLDNMKAIYRKKKKTKPISKIENPGYPAGYVIPYIFYLSTFFPSSSMTNIFI